MTKGICDYALSPASAGLMVFDAPSWGSALKRSTPGFMLPPASAGLMVFDAPSGVPRYSAPPKLYSVAFSAD